MKRIFLILIFLSVVGFLFTKIIPEHDPIDPPLPNFAPVTPDTSRDKLTTKIVVDQHNYVVGKIEVSDKQSVYLKSNLTEPQNAVDLKEEFQCSALTSAAFYTTENTHIGLFISDGVRQKSGKQSALFDGVVGQSSTGKITISKDFSETNRDWALQSGPLLKTKGKAHSLQIRNDEEARRNVAALTRDGQFILLTFYNPQSYFRGPFLAKLPEALEEFEKESGIEIVDAINLDGGSASAFYSTDLFLEELSPIGSFFCVTE